MSENKIKTKKNYEYLDRRNTNVVDEWDLAKYGKFTKKDRYVKRSANKFDDVERNAEYEKKIVTNTMKTTDESDFEQRRVNSLLHVIFKIYELSGFWVEERIVLKDRKTGKIWR